MRSFLPRGGLVQVQPLASTVQIMTILRRLYLSAFIQPQINAYKSADDTENSPQWAFILKEFDEHHNPTNE